MYSHLSSMAIGWRVHKKGPIALHNKGSINSGERTSIALSSEGESQIFVCYRFETMATEAWETRLQQMNGRLASMSAFERSTKLQYINEYLVASLYIDNVRHTAKKKGLYASNSKMQKAVGFITIGEHVP